MSIQFLSPELAIANRAQVPASIEPAREYWAYPQIRDNRNTKRNVWVEVSTDFREQALNILPPIYVAGGFMVSEPADHTLDTGEAIYTGFATINGRHFANETTRREWPARYADLRRHLAIAAPERT